MRQKITKVLFMAGAIAFSPCLLTGCIEDVQEDRQGGEGIVFCVGEDPESNLSGNDAGTGTRGAQTTTATLSSFGMTATVYPSNQTYTGKSLGNYFYNVEVQPNVPTSFYWPTADYKIAFYGYAPYGNANISVSAKGTAGPPSYTYTVPENPASQIDFMTTQVTDRPCGTRTTVPLTFTHRLSDIRITAYNQQNDPITVKSVSLLGMKYTGTLTGNTWSLSGSVNSISSHPFTLSLNSTITSGQTVDLTGTGNHLMVLPQTIASGTDMIKVVTVEGGDEKTYTHTLASATTLAMGTSYTYRLTLGNGQLIVSTETDAEDWKEIGSYLVFTALESGTFSFYIPANITTSYYSWVEYSLDNGTNWVRTNNTNSDVTVTTPTVAAGGKVMWRGSGTLTATAANDASASRFLSTCRFKANGNVLAIIDPEQNVTILPLGSRFCRLFDGCNKLVEAPPLPAKSLTNNCYHDMFRNCTALITPPDLPATTMVSQCYAGMFQGCSSLTTAPELPATTLADGCYDWMFVNCTSLRKAPNLPATTLFSVCYRQMFRGCSSLSYIRMLATNISASNCLQNWVQGVSGAGTFVKASSMTTLPTGDSGIPTGWTVQNY